MLPQIKSFEVAIIGGGPAGLSAAIVLSRACRRVVVFDHGQPRNYAADHVYCYLGIDGASPWELRERGRTEAARYGATFVDAEVVEAECFEQERVDGTRFSVATHTHAYHVRAILFASGVIDDLPKLEGLESFYGKTVHHCPYCDGWEHRDKRIVAFGRAASVAKLALTLRGWSTQVTACTHGDTMAGEDRAQLARHGITVVEKPILRLEGADNVLSKIRFQDESAIDCDALFFSSGQGQRSRLPEMLDCETDEKGLIVTYDKHCTKKGGLFLAGDADGHVQFAIVAAAEGATAATAINHLLLQEDFA